MVKNPPAKQETWVGFWVRKIPWRRNWQATPVFLTGKFHGQRKLADYSPGRHIELDTTEQLSMSRGTHTIEWWRIKQGIIWDGLTC